MSFGCTHSVILSGSGACIRNKKPDMAGNPIIFRAVCGKNAPTPQNRPSKEINFLPAHILSAKPFSKSLLQRQAVDLCRL